MENCLGVKKGGEELMKQKNNKVTVNISKADWLTLKKNSNWLRRLEMYQNNDLHNHFRDPAKEVVKVEIKLVKDQHPEYVPETDQIFLIDKNKIEKKFVSKR